MPHHPARARRRLTLTALVALVAGLVAGGCRSDPDVAAYVGDERLTEARVEAMVADAEAKAAGKEELKAPSRAEVVTAFVLGRTCEAKQAADKFPDPAQKATPETVEQNEKVPAASEYAKEQAAAYTCLNGAPVGQPRAPTDAEMQEIYDVAKANNLIDRPLSDIRDQLVADPGVRQAMAFKTMLGEMVAAGDVMVNPRYRPLTFTVSTLGTSAPLVVTVLGQDGTGAVRDLR